MSTRYLQHTDPEPVGSLGDPVILHETYYRITVTRVRVTEKDGKIYVRSEKDAEGNNRSVYEERRVVSEDTEDIFVNEQPDMPKFCRL